MTREPNSSVIDAGLFPDPPEEGGVGVSVLNVKLVLGRNDAVDMAGKTSMNHEKGW